MLISPGSGKPACLHRGGRGHGNQLYFRMESLTVTLSLAVGEAPIFTTLGSRPPQDPRQRNPIDIN